MNERVLTDKRLLEWDSLIVFLNLSASYSIIPYLIFFQDKRQICFLIIFILNFLYMIIRFPRIRLCHEPLFIIYILMHLVSLVSALQHGEPAYSIVAYLFLNSSFYIILYNLNSIYRKVYNSKERLWYLVRGYIWLVSICLFSCLSLLSLRLLGFSLRVNRISSSVDLFAANIENLYSTYYRPYFLGIVQGQSSEVVGFAYFKSAGTICGIYHEPHILAQMTFPALFLFLFLFPQKKELALFVFFLILLIASSVTNIITVLICCLIYLLWKYRTSFISGLLTSAVVLVVVFLSIRYSDYNIMQFVFDKVEDSGSMRYSSILLNFAVTPSTILGTSFYDTQMINTLEGFSADKDVGYLNFFFNIFYLGVCIYYLLKQFMGKGSMSIALLLFGSYFMLHSAKLAMVTYSLTMLIFVAFIVSHVFLKEDKLAISKKINHV